jgi:hypothetical protein
MTLDNINTCYHNKDMDHALTEIAENILIPIESSCRDFLSHGMVIFTFRFQDGKIVYQEVDCKRGIKVKNAKLVR